MNKILAISILGLGISGAVLLTSIPPLFDSPIKDGAKMYTAVSAVVCIIFVVSTLVFRRRFDKMQNEKRE
ncbi:putative membrane protein [Croceifilum oryzae]|uniref:Membrane protein n=1 Tax=Croceifilum oryzae TaxID=1553429 RepID=A0AAJ1TQE3_9BACL|nr:putative membrane protein [Croceifilum oryzae]